MMSEVEPNAWHLIRLAFQVGFFLCCFYLLNLIWELRKVAEPRSRLRPRWSILPGAALITLFFGIILGHQASWQLVGETRPQFIGFMQLHDRRELNPAHRLHRGSILDRRGEILAYSEEVLGEVFRIYPDGPAFAHVVGYSHPRFGASGIERVETVRLNGGSLTNLDEWGQLGRQLVIPEKRRRGRDLRITLDADLQRQAFHLLGERRGAVVVIRPIDGAVLALVSTPSFDPNRLGPELFDAEAPGSPLLNRATQGFYPPGSVLKLVPAALAAEQGFHESLECPADGFTTSRRYRKIRDHEYYLAQRNGKAWHGHGKLDLATAFARSSNVFFAQIGVLYGHQAFYETTARMLFNRTIVLHESPFAVWQVRTGRTPRMDLNDRYGLAQMAIGQGKIEVTPFHMAIITAAVANGGMAAKPRLVEASDSIEGTRILSQETAARLATMMRRVVTEGTGRSIQDPRLDIAGKTGTAEHQQGEPHSWFVGFAPASQPALAVAVLVENGGFGSAVAAPIAKELLLSASSSGLLD